MEEKITSEKINEIWEVLDADGTANGILDDIENGVDLSEKVPEGEYEVKIVKLEPTISKNNNPMIACWLQIVNGELIDKYIFQYFVLKEAFQVKRAVEFLESLKCESDNVNLTFESFTQLKDNVALMFNKSNNRTFHIKLTYKKDFPNVEILEVLL